ncbi:PREDICTED: histone deacetylase HDT1-like isoform X2 [Lupinus angustifolius]|uniref:histone deacetylase HDT1-like isoform X2 n=1 Tax=Lupinus angustifolius TaxID=3871 RepID=UPI00092F72C3|nr:PREDICTED: histone deacetylase HDT1-like isoform X2 [Lupinus angustifolius]
MEFWGTEVKVGETVKIDPEEIEAYVHLSQAALGESKKDKANEPVFLHLKVGEQKLVLGTLSRDKIPQASLDVVLDTEFELSHSSKSSSVFFTGYKALIPDEDGDEDDFDSDEDLPLPAEENGKSLVKAEEAKVAEPKKADAKVGVPAKQVKIADPKKEENADDDDSDEDDDDDSDDFGSSDDELDDADSDGDEEDDSEDDVETPPKKVELGKKRANDSASKTPVSNKKAKNVTPEKTDGKKGGHIATPHPAKKGGKSPNNDGKSQSPKSGGQSGRGGFKGQSPKSGGQSGQSGRGGFKKSFNSGGGSQQNNSGGGRQQNNNARRGK